jgi:hypothetical protein
MAEPILFGRQLRRWLMNHVLVSDLSLASVIEGQCLDFDQVNRWMNG